MRAPAARRPLVSAALLACALAAAGAGLASCGSGGSQLTAGCRRDDECGGGMACTGGACLPRTAPPPNWAIELMPRSDSSAAFTQLTGVTVDATGALLLFADARATVTGAFQSGGGAPIAAVAHVVVTQPAAIPGRPDVQFETNVGAATGSGSDGPRFTLSVPAGALGRDATINLMPSSPDDSVYAPVTIHAPLAADLALTAAGATASVRGRLFTAIGDPQPGFRARAFQDGALVSNVALTDAAGAFQLTLSPAAAGLDPARPITVQLSPAADPPDAPTFTSAPFSAAADTDLGDVALPAFVQPNFFQFTVRGGAEDGPPVGGAVVRAHTVLANAAAGVTDFQSDARTDAAGDANLAMLPGTATASRSYDVAVIPPPGSPYGARCLTQLPLAAGGTASAPANLQAVALGVRPVVTGTVVDSGGTPVPGMTILATRTDAGSDACADAAGSPAANAATGGDGVFTLPLDAGTYRFDYDPPSGAPLPRLTELAVVVTGDVARQVQLPAGALVEGDARGPDMAPLPSASVRLYEVSGGQALLRGETRSDAAGHFRLVVPVSD